MKLHITFEVNPGELWEDDYLSNIYEVIEVGRDYVEIRKTPTSIISTVTPESFYKKLSKIG